LALAKGKKDIPDYFTELKEKENQEEFRDVP